jgi:hypothetical protein
VHGVRDRERRQRLPHGARDHTRGVAIERVGGAIGGFGRRREELEEGSAARPDDERAGGLGQESVQPQRGRRDVERIGRDGQEDVQPERAERALQRRERTGRRYGPAGHERRQVEARSAYLSWNGYGVDSPSDGGKLADLTAFSTQPPVGVPANLPVTVADEILPFLPMTTFTIAIPGTLYSL